MPVYHFTLHAYRSWGPDRPRGYVRRGKGVQPPGPTRAEQYDRNAKQERVLFDRAMQRILIIGAFDICSRRGWRLHAAGMDPTHAHYVVSWRGFIPWKQVMNKLKNVLSYLLGVNIGPPGRNWFVRDESRKRVTRRAHFDYLLDVYLPDHRGLFWREGQSLP